MVVQGIRLVILVVINMFRLLLVEAPAGNDKQPVAGLKRFSDRCEHPIWELGAEERTLSACQTYFNGLARVILTTAGSQVRAAG